MSSPSINKRPRPEDETSETMDHRKRRRNRTTQSCLNCHGSKRLCDRKRPACGRCVKLGLSGTCVYEVDDINRRDSTQDETTLLKNRIAELEGFIREFKRKPHPRWTVESKTGSTSASRSSSLESDIDSCSDSKNASSSSFSESTPRSESPSVTPHTPYDYEGGPIYLTDQSITTHSITSSNFALSRCPDLSNSPTSPMSNSSAIELDSIFDFNCDFPCADDALERVFNRILHQEARETSHAHQPCQCMRGSTALAILELAPHVRKAIEFLRSLPEHASIQGSVHSCDHLTRLQALDETLYSIVKSGAKSRAPPTPAYQAQSLHSTTGLAPLSSSAKEDSPLQRVLARRALSCSHPPTSSRTTHISKSIENERVLWDTVDTMSNTNLTGTSSDRFMSWEPPSPREWPRTISL